LEKMGDWNSIHLGQDMCVNCHGGNGSTMDKFLAHESLVAQPLSDIYTNCHSCHPATYIERSDQIAALLDVTPDSCATPTSVSIDNKSSGFQTGGSAISPEAQESCLEIFLPDQRYAGNLLALFP
jgi:hypothetical protein